jgi:hypothetical protein
MKSPTKAPSPTSTDQNKGNASKSGSPANPIQGSKAWDAARGVRPTKPTVIAGHNGDPQGGPEQRIKHHSVAAPGYKPHPKRPY